MIKCEIDGKEFANGGVMARYLKKQYQLTYQQYYHKYISKSDEIPKCKCGCEKEMSWSNIGYREYAKGHYSRVHNNWGHNPKAIQKSAETRRRQFASGERTMWNKGLTKDIDERVRINGERSKKSINSNPNELKRRSELMKINRLNGIIPTFLGPKHSQWIDGRSQVAPMVYADRRLYKEWKYPILVRDGFKCKECGNPGPNLHIHHDKEYMSEIIQKHMIEITVERLKDFEIKRMIVDAVVDYHIKNQISGIALCNECHEKYHPSLNFC